MLTHDFFQCLYYGRNFYNLFSNFLNVLIYSNYLGNYSLNFNEFGHLHKLFTDAFHLMNLSYQISLLNDLLDNLLSNDNLFHFSFNGN